MTVPPGLLLSALGSVGRALFGPSGGGTAERPAGVDFESLLRDAESGLLRSGRGVDVAPESTLELTAEQLERVAAAADRAEAAGADRAVVLLDERALVVDVQTRRVTGEIDVASGEPVTGVDVVLRAPPAGGESGSGGAGGPVPLPGRSPIGVSPSLLELMSETERSAADRRGN